MKESDDSEAVSRGAWFALLYLMVAGSIFNAVVSVEDAAEAMGS